LAAAAITISLAACSAPEDNKDAEGSDNTGAPSSQSPEEYMSDLEAAAKEEGELNVIALPPEWANYGEVIKAFEDKYGIKVNSQLPDTDSQTEIDTAQKLAGSGRQPDVFDLSQAVALANTDMYAPYQVQTWADIPDQFKEPTGLWVNDYGGYMSIGYDSSKVPEVTSLEDLLGSDFAGKVALNGNPTEAGAAFSGVMMASIAEGGSADDIGPGVDFFAQLQDAGNFLPVDPSAATIEAGQTPVVFDWDYNNAAVTPTVPDWKVMIPDGVALAGYYFQAINKDAAHPNAARLWEEFLYSDEGQNLWLGGGARPIRADAMVEAGTIDQEAYDALPEVSGDPVVVSDEQAAKAADYLAKNWAKATG
jgi:putative spermidine/putrescine transport system substrate-binding protein